ncbi:MAG TPA: MerR family transcriptional regulator [Burkholderiaceae bacterium]|nr:MerR family transcriptional regulator [Burkholderiaceae bacterium]
MNIAAVERDTGLSKDTLRVWERRYGFPAPQRDASGQRVYTAADVEKLRLAKRLLDYGYRPGKILAHRPEHLMQMVHAATPVVQRRPDAAHDGAEIESLLDLLRTHRIEELRRQLSQSLLRLGLAQFVSGVVAALNARVGDAWARGRLEVFEEHLYSESIQLILRNAISGIPRPGVDPPLVLLTTFPRESHGLGLLMAEAFFALEGCRCISLGVQTPVPDIVRAAQIQKVDIVALSFSDSVNANQALGGIAELRSQLPANFEIWVGGNCSILDRRQLDGVTRLRLLTDIGPALVRWRKNHRAAAK